MFVELAKLSHPSDKSNPTITLYCKGGNLIILLTCFVNRPEPTLDGGFVPQIVIDKVCCLFLDLFLLVFGGYPLTQRSRDTLAKTRTYFFHGGLSIMHVDPA